MKAARIYAQRGWRVVPLHDVSTGRCSCGKPACPSAGKHPRIGEWEKRATSDLEIVDAWIERWPAGNVGIATGHTFFVFDVDGERGRESLKQWRLSDCHLPETVIAQTGSGGIHYLFKSPAFPVANSASRISPGIDIRGVGGQIVVAPSVSAKGSYRWLRSPFEHEIAEAPTWLLDEIRAERPSGAIKTPGASAENRGYFPPAAPDVLEAARQALAKHGPAIEGSGGDDQTWRAAALLTHDFALSQDEAWPLFEAWNETCEPPWSENDLRAKLAGGSKYGKAEFGAKRTMDALDRAKKLIEDFRSAGAKDNAIQPLVDAVNAIARTVKTATRALLIHEVTAATGLTEREQGTPKVRATDVELPDGSIIVSAAIHEAADAAEKAITERVFQRTGVLCEIVKTAKVTFIHDLEPTRVQDLMSQSATFVRLDEKGAVTMAPPLNVASIITARRTHDTVRVLDAVTTAPVFLADGEILQERGYNAEARVYLEPSVQVQVVEHPSRDDARAAVLMLHDLLSDFKFAEPADFSAWLAGLLSPLVKAATGNAPAPLICISASSPGAGKTLLADVLSQIVSGNKIENSPYNPKDLAEWGKRLTAFVKAGIPVRAFDNCNGPFGDENLDRLITASTWSDRVLGASEAPPLPNVTTWLATGNNIEPVGDTVRRVLMVRIEVDTDKPQERTGFRYDLEGGHVLTNRSELLSAALTILRAYHVAGRPVAKIPSWGSFSEWSGLVRQALVWTGLADPFLTQRRAQSQLNEPENQAHDFWLGVIDGCDGQSGTIAALANTRDVASVLNLRQQVTAFNLHTFIGRFVDKPRQGRRIRRDQDERKNQVRFYVERIASA